MIANKRHKLPPKGKIIPAAPSPKNGIKLTPQAEHTPTKKPGKTDPK